MKKPEVDLSKFNLTDEQLQRAGEYLDAATEIARRDKRRKINTYYPDKGPLRRELYVPHMTYFRAGKKYRERLFLSGNRIGKTEGVGGYEMALHLTGMYPEWWEGRRFDRPVRAWAAGDTSQTVRDILQTKIVGPPGNEGTGLLPGETIKRTRPKAGSVSDAIESVEVTHATGGISRLGFKSYDQKAKSFQGVEQDVILLDEEPPLDVYAECLMRTMTTKGMILCTFTPLLGMSETVLSFLPDGRLPAQNGEAIKSGKFVVMATWDDAPHLSEEDKKELWNSIPPYQRDARMKGIPQLGSGAIYPIPEEEIIVDPFEIPPYWPRAFAMDVGWKRTAALWGAKDPASGQAFMYSEYYRGQAEPSIHSVGINARGHWIPGTIDPSARGRSQTDGTRLMSLYSDEPCNLNLCKANNAVEAGLLRGWEMLSTGQVKIFKNLINFFTEYRMYRRDENGKVVKKEDHLMDCFRYWVMTGYDIAENFSEAEPREYAASTYQEDKVDESTGY